MMEPMTETDAIDGSSPPPPIPSSPPPEDTNTSLDPPEKPIKTRRGTSPSKEKDSSYIPNGDAPEQLQNGTNDHTELGRDSNGPETSPEEPKANGFEEKKVNGVDVTNGVKPVNGVETPEEDVKGKSDIGKDMDDVDLRSPAKVERTNSRAAVRERAVDVSEEDDTPRGYENEEESPRRNASVKRTPTMEFKKQCSKIVRIRTMILQNLGKADKTTDDVFDEYEANFTKQQNNANRLHRDVTNYLRCARALHGASKALFETLNDVYEPDWTGYDHILTQATSSDMLWNDFLHKLNDQSVVPLTAYQIQFPEIRKRIDKRGRKLVDYDSHRHQLEALQKSNRTDEYKLARCKDQLEQARVTYDALNKELYEELPSIYEKRVKNTSDCLQSLYAAESVFMRESAKISQELEVVAEKLSAECLQGKYIALRGTPITPRPVSMSVLPNAQATWFVEPPVSPHYESREDDSPSRAVNGSVDSGQRSSVSGRQSSITTEDSVPRVNGVSSSGIASVESDASHKSPKEEVGRPYEEIQFEESNKVNGTSAVIGTKVPADVKPKSDEVYDIPIGATTTNLPDGVLYQVRTTYKYEREDVDELSFEVGETINVVEYDDPEEQEEGWLCGYKVATNEKGLFPANFTRPL